MEDYRFTGFIQFSQGILTRKNSRNPESGVQFIHVEVLAPRSGIAVITHGQILSRVVGVEQNRLGRSPQSGARLAENEIRFRGDDNLIIR